MAKIGVDVDPIWEQLYADGKHLNKYPFNHVPNFFFRYLPRDRERSDITVLEVGFGAGNNLWMCAREGTRVCGVDAAPSAVKFANDRFREDGLSGDLAVGDFCALSYEGNSIDMAINRQALTQVAHSRSKIAVGEIHRCLKPGGYFWSNMFSDKTLKAGDFIGDGLWENISDGILTGVGQTAFHSREQILEMYGSGWEIVELVHQESTFLSDDRDVPYCEWYVVARKSAEQESLQA